MPNHMQYRDGTLANTKSFRAELLQDITFT